MGDVGHRIGPLAFGTIRQASATSYPSRDFVENGGLTAYAVNYPDLYFRAASFVDKILRGVRPADLPVEQPTKFELTINLKTAKALGLTGSPTLIARADESLNRNTPLPLV